MTVLFSPFGNSQYFDANGDPAVGYTVTTYAAGSSTLQSSYTDSTGLVANANPTTLNATGLNPNGQFWLTSGLTYKFVIKDASGVTVQTVDAVSGVATAAAAVNQFQASGVTPTYISGTSFSLVGDQTTEFHVGRRLQFTVTAGTVYGTITASAFGVLTTVTMRLDGATALDSGLSAVNLSILRADYLAMPLRPAFMASISTSSLTIPNSTATKLRCDTETLDTNGNYDNATNYRFTPTKPGVYAIHANVIWATAVDGASHTTYIYKNGSVYNYQEGRFSSTGTQGIGCSAVMLMNGTTDYVEAYVSQSTGGSINVLAGSSFCGSFSG